MANLAQESTDGDFDLSTVAIPDSARMPPFALTMAWWAVCSAVFYFVWALVVGVVVYVLMMADIFSKILQALAYQGVFVVAWVGVALAHIMSARYEQLVGAEVECRDSHVPQFNPGGLAAWFAGAFVGLALNNASGFLASLSAPATFVISWMGYSALLAGAKRTWFVRNTLADQ
jgi:uncharacterized membrane protein